MSSSSGLLRTWVVLSALAAACGSDGEKLVPLSDVVQVEGGAAYGLALLRDGTVLAWGENTSGQLGDGTNDTRLLPVRVFGPGSGVKAISAGNFHSMVLMQDGTVLSWGINSVGQLGDGTLTSRTTPGPVSGLGAGSGVMAIAAGFTHSLALKGDGTVLCWGRNEIAACGDDTIESPRKTPVETKGLGAGSGVIAVTAGANASMALLGDGSVLAWGNNNAGQVGDGTRMTRRTPTPVMGLGAGADVIQVVNASISGANSSYALKRDGAVFAWGANASGQLGDGTVESRNVPVPVSGLGAGSGVTALAPGGSHILALKADGTALAWGRNASGQLGDGTRELRNVPTAIPGLTHLKALAGAGQHSYAITDAGALLAWGNNATGQLGNGAYEGVPDPTPTSGLGAGSGVTAVAAGPSYSLALKGDGTVLAWGLNINGQLGDGSTEVSRVAPVTVALPSSAAKVIAVSAGDTHALALRDDGEVLAWGSNSAGELGTGNTMASSTPAPVKGLGSGSGVIAVAAGGNRSLALKSDGAVLRWGQGAPNAMEPVAVADLGAGSGVTAIAGGWLHSLVLKSDGTVLGWGTNAVAQLGDGSTTSSDLPVQVAGLGTGSGVTAISTWTVGGLALRANGTFVGWGAADQGQAGDGKVGFYTSPVEASAIPAGASIAALRGGGSQVTLLRSDGSVLVWGSNGSGQVGDGSLATRLSPVQVFGPGSDIVAVSPSSIRGTHTLALKRDGSVLAWGSNSSGELGDGTVYATGLTPANVLVAK